MENIYVDYPTGKSKTFLIHVPGCSSDECKVLGDFGFKYIKRRPTKEHRKAPVPRNKFNRYQENNIIVSSALDEIMLHENQKVNAEKEAPEHIESIFMRKNYQI